MSTVRTLKLYLKDFEVTQLKEKMGFTGSREEFIEKYKFSPSYPYFTPLAITQGEVGDELFSELAQTFQALSDLDTKPRWTCYTFTKYFEKGLSHGSPLISEISNLAFNIDNKLRDDPEVILVLHKLLEVQDSLSRIVNKDYPVSSTFSNLEDYKD